MRPDYTQSVVTELDLAIDDHVRWLEKWHRVMICGSSGERSLIAEEARLECRFDAWYGLNRETGLADQAAFNELDLTHQELHELARQMASRGWHGQSIGRHDYDRMMQSVSGFNEIARRIIAGYRAALSDLDVVTGLYNRHRMLADLQREHERAARGNEPCSLALADIDELSRINEAHGLPVGDRILAGTARCMLAQLRPYDGVYRLGGEEFLICLPNTDLKAAATIVERLRQALAGTPLVLDDGQTVPATASFGLVHFRPAMSVDDAFYQLEDAMQAAKAGGRNRTVIWREGGKVVAGLQETVAA